MNHNFAYIQKVTLSLSLKIIDTRIHITNQQRQKNLGAEICHVNTTQHGFKYNTDFFCVVSSKYKPKFCIFKSQFESEVLNIQNL
jgi:hypothetical protein